MLEISWSKGEEQRAWAPAANLDFYLFSWSFECNLISWKVTARRSKYRRKCNAKFRQTGKNNIAENHRNQSVASLQSQHTRWKNDTLCVTSTLPMWLFRPFYVLRTNLYQNSFCKRFLHSSAILSSTVNCLLLGFILHFFIFQNKSYDAQCLCNMQLWRTMPCMYIFLN